MVDDALVEGAPVRQADVEFFLVPTGVKSHQSTFISQFPGNDLIISFFCKKNNQKQKQNKFLFILARGRANDKAPSLTDLKAQLFGSTAQITPNDLPDLYQGEPVMLMADSNSLKGVLKITGKIGDTPWEVKLPLVNAAKGTGISKLWARRRIAEIEVSSTLGTIDQASAEKAVLKVALEHHLVSSQTSLVAVDKSPRRPAGYKLTRADVPLMLPAGWVFESVFGESETQIAPHTDQKANAEFLQLAKMETPATVAPAQQVSLPQTATNGELLALLGLALGLLGLALRQRKVVMI